MGQSTRKTGRVKSGKPYPDFPLFPHASGRWCKKVKQRFHYFGKVADDPTGEAALRLWLDQRDDLMAGRTPRTTPGGLTVADLVNAFLTAKRHRVDTRELAPRTWQDYHVVCDRVVRVFGRNRLVDDLAACDFARLRADFAQTRGPVSLLGDITRVRGLFKFAYDEGLIDKPTRYGQSFKRPTRKTLRQSRAANGKRMFDAHEVRAMLEAAGQPLRAMILLGINCGLGNSDCGALPQAALDLKGGWLDLPRPKTGVSRRCPMWPKTVQALREALAKRRKPKDKAHDGLVFLTAKGASWNKTRADNPIAKQLSKVLKSLGIQRKGVNFYALRHTFQTIGDEARDPVATRHIMGHAENSNDMSAVYREAVGEDRLRAVVDHVHNWLFSETEESSDN